ncbi:MAG: hypothetical protein VX438_13425, partial [Planctomycetota bacterium]|nr:hypothetical protein [Planctomycetota bacterium]
VADGKELFKIDVPEGGLFTCDFSPDGKTVVAGGFDGKLHIIQVATGKTTQTLTPAPLEVASN